MTKTDVRRIKICAVVAASDAATMMRQLARALSDPDVELRLDWLALAEATGKLPDFLLGWLSWQRKAGGRGQL